MYLATKSHKQVIAPGGRGVFIDPETGEVCWPALVCNNPNCPGRRNGEPFLFCEADPGVYVKSGKTLGYDMAASQAAPHLGTGCPRCAANRNFATETAEVRKQYINWVQPYVLPETAEKMKQLDAELQKRAAYDRTQRVAPSQDRHPPPASGGPQPTRADPASRPQAGTGEETLR